MSERDLTRLGTCPKCSKGQMIKGTIGYSCNYFKNIEDKCTFVIFKEYFGKEIDEDMAKQIIENGKTEVFDDLVKKDGNTFAAALVYVDGYIKPEFAQVVLNTECPKCGGNILDLANGYVCEDFSQRTEEGERLCTVFIPKTIAERSISKEEADTILQGQSTEFLEGFINKNGKEFSSKLFLNEEGSVNFDSVLCDCPMCDGKIYVGTKAYNCNNWNNKDTKCNFSIWREISSRFITPNEAKYLCENKISKTLKGFKNKDGKFDRKLTINDDGKIIMI